MTPFKLFGRLSEVLSEEERPGVADLPGTYNRFLSKVKEGRPAVSLLLNDIYYKVINFLLIVAIGQTIQYIKEIDSPTKDDA
jgi:hypothetical protein